MSVEVVDIIFIRYFGLGTKGHHLFLYEGPKKTGSVYIRISYLARRNFLDTKTDEMKKKE